MAELQFEAPLASFETEEWNDFNDFQTAMNAESKKNEKSVDETNDKTDPASDNFGVGETFSGSLQDLVKSLDEKITNCFCNYDTNVEKIAPVQMRTKDDLTTDCPTWWTITGQFGNILPIDWSQSYARKLQEKALNLGERKTPEPVNLDLSDDEELATAMDYHSMIISSHHHNDEDHVVTADEVISELEIMMEDSGTDRSESEVEFPEMPTSPYTKLKETLSQLPKYSVEELKGMSNTAINELLSDYELTIKELSETLVQELALRDELEYDKELKNQFISLLLNIQKKRREAKVDKKRRKSKTLSPNNNQVAVSGNNNNSPTAESGPSVFLSTVIPYHPQQGVANSEQLQIYIKILRAINEDSPTVPSLLTDYILKVLCPT
ncbi:fasciculation and elongation protein zeta-2-like [Mercenaria mercenaria]|uniref:fasciculation and elongation protein zeta-2-like n=1 Tax=Mercenaria mercenaria TaxID=6596 RepID=UPI00234F00B7|nr:fasciculation and elongation protein zeta-2-like [Mercenaria mercenaria]